MASFYDWFKNNVLTLRYIGRRKSHWISLEIKFCLQDKESIERFDRMEVKNRSGYSNGLVRRRLNWYSLSSSDHSIVFCVDTLVCWFQVAKYKSQLSVGIPERSWAGRRLYLKLQAYKLLTIRDTPNWTLCWCESLSFWFGRFNYWFDRKRRSDTWYAGISKIVNILEFCPP